MGSSRYVGRVGALAVALGVGCAIASPAGVAWADSAESSTSSDTGTDSSPATASDTTSSGTDTPDSHEAPTTKVGSSDTDVNSASQDTDANSDAENETSPSASTIEVAPGVTVSSSGGAQTSDRADDKDEDGDADGDADESQAVKSGSRNGSARDAAAVADSSARTPRASAQTVQTDSFAEPTAKSPTEAEHFAVIAAPLQVITSLNTIVTPLLSQILAAIPGGPAETPLGWVLLAATRRQVRETEEAQTATTRTLSTETTLMTTAAATDQPPNASATFGTPAGATGAVSGQMVGTDPEGAALTYTVTAAPIAGALDFDGATGQFTYTPTTSQRINAGVTTTTNDTIAMTVTVSDGVNDVSVAVDIPVSAAPINKLAEIGAINDAHALAVYGNRAYVTNKTAGTVTVIDTMTNTVIGTFAAGSKPDGLVLKPDGKTLYVSSETNNTITVVNTSTGAVTTTINIAKPSAMAISSSGTTLYVTSYDAGTMIKINTSTNTVAGTVSLPAGSRPTDIVVSPDKTKLYVISTKSTGGGSVAVIGYTSSVSTLVTDLVSTPTGLAISPDNKRLYVSTADGKLSIIDSVAKTIVSSTAVGGVLADVTVSNDGSLVTVTDTRGRVTALDADSGRMLRALSTRTSTTAMSVAPTTTASADGTRLYVTDYDADKVYVVSLVPTNSLPQVGEPIIGSPNATTGTLTGTVGVTDPDGDTLQYTVTKAPSKGTVTVRADGSFTYTPTSSARHAASTAGASEALTTDTFTVSVSDAGGAVTTTVKLDILPANRVPVPTKTVGAPNTTTGVVKGSVTATDGDWDVRTYTVTAQPTKGTVVVTSTGAFTYTPTAQARHAAAKIGAPETDMSDAFTITVDDGHGGVVPVAVTVTVSPSNSVPTAPTLTSSSTNASTGVVTGAVKATDADNDTLTYKSTAATKGTMTMQTSGTFTYTPTLAARQAAAAPGATTAAKTETVTVTVTDGYGGTATMSLTLNISPYVSGNVAPTNGRATVNNPTSAIGEVTGTVAADDANGDTLTYTLSAAPTKGLVTVDSATGAFRYVPDVDERYAAATTTGIDADLFTVTVTDGKGGATTVQVQVQVAPPMASSIDQRSTTVAVAASDMFYYNQTDLNRAFQEMQASGIGTVRVVFPWAAIEMTNNSWRWTEADRVVNTASAYGVEVLAVLNSTPTWAVESGVALSGRPNTTEYAQFAGTVAARYAGKIAAYEIWNEPNAVTFWSPAPSAAEYTELLKAAFPVIKAADPNAVVVAAGLGALVDYGTIAINPVRFVEEMYAAGAAGYFDAMAFHPYLYTKSFTGTMPTNQDSAANQARRIHELMVANGDGNKKIWVTEYGQPSAYAGEATQAAYLGDFLRAWRELDYAGPAFVYSLRDYPNNDPNHASFGLFRQDWTRKSALTVVEEVIAENQELLDL